MHEFKAWPKIPRLLRDCTITEKIDGTNAAIHIDSVTLDTHWDFPLDSYSVSVDGIRYVLTAQSRTRRIWPGKSSDNHGFAAWVYDNAAELVTMLGTGTHYGEWWGSGIQRGYGLAPGERRFSLFNSEKYPSHFEPEYIGRVRVSAVPVLHVGAFSTGAVRAALEDLRDNGSVAAAGWRRPEGICVYHHALRSYSKVTLDSNDQGKWEAAR